MRPARFRGKNIKQTPRTPCFLLYGLSAICDFLRSPHLHISTHCYNGKPGAYASRSHLPLTKLLQLAFGELASRQQQPLNWGRGLHPRHAQRLTAAESQHRLTLLKQCATYEIEANYTSLYKKVQSAQPNLFSTAHHTKPDKTSMRVIPLSLWGVKTRLD